MLEENGQIVFRYCDENGELTDEANPNGSRSNIAGICNQDRNVLGMSRTRSARARNFWDRTTARDIQVIDKGDRTSSSVI